jgi:hypothetical protein
MEVAIGAIIVSLGLVMIMFGPWWLMIIGAVLVVLGIILIVD